MGPLSSSLSIPLGLQTGIPPISSHILSALFASSYVGSIYLSNLFSRPPTASSSSAKSSKSTLDEPDVDIPAIDPHAPKPGERDHPETIRRRMKAVSLSSLGSMTIVYGVVKSAGKYSASEALLPTLRLLGIPSTLSLPTQLSMHWVLPYLLAPTLLLGPLVTMYFEGSLPFQGETTASSPNGKSRIGSLFEEWGLVEIRNYIVGPLTEEISFRSCILAASILGRQSPKSLVFLTPLWFGIAHAHHAWDVFRKGGKTGSAAIQAILGSLFQLTYTTLFGWFASYLFIRTGSVIPPLVAHVFCNMMGIYFPNTAISRNPSKRLVIVAAYVLGIVGFVLGLRKL